MTGMQRFTQTKVSPITKSISRFVRNTLGAKGEVLLTILSSLAQDESRSISENCTWGIRRRFEAGKHKMSTKRFLGFDTDENGKLIINIKQAPIVTRLFQEFLDGKTPDYILRRIGVSLLMIIRN